MKEQKEEFKLTIFTKVKAGISTGLLLVGLVALFLGKTPQTLVAGVVCMLYSYLLDLDARVSAVAEILKHALTPKEEDESNGQ